MAFPDSISDYELIQKFGVDVVIQPIPDLTIAGLTP
jgi:hypothetical protein